MSRIIPKGSVDQSIYFEVPDSTSTTGGKKTGLVFNSAGLTAYYVRNGGTATAITLATLAAANSAHSDGGFKEVDATNMPGVYRLDTPDAVCATGAESAVVTLKGATGMVQVSVEIQLSEPFAAAVRSAVGLASANLDAQLSTIDLVTNDTNNRIPAALVGGRMDSSVGAMAANVMTAAAAAADLTTEFQNGLATSAALATVDDFLDTEVAAILAAVDTEVAAIKAKTDQLTFGATNTLNANITHVKDRSLALAGSDTPQYGVNP